MRKVLVLALALAGLEMAAGEAQAYGRLLRKKAEASGTDQSYGRPPATYDSPRATPYGYVLTSEYPSYTAPFGYNPMLYPRFSVIQPRSMYPGPIPPPDESKLTGGSDDK